MLLGGSKSANTHRTFEARIERFDLCRRQARPALNRSTRLALATQKVS